jgi:N-ethylmaleimide reductase
MKDVRMPQLFSPIRIGAIDLAHRVVLAPLTRMRADMPGNVPGDLMATYYGQRASEGGLMITEATFISPTGNGGYASPGILSDAQVAGWRKVIDAVHARGAKLLLQLWHVGRQSHVDLQPNGQAPIAPSAIQAEVRALLSGGPAIGSIPRAIELSEIPSLVDEYRKAAERAKVAGFDGVEVHGANGYLIDQFLQDSSNRRTDAYGGSVENRARFVVEVVETVTAVWGSDRVGVRIGPSNKFGGMDDSAPDVTFPYVARALARFGLAYLHVIEPRVTGNVSDDAQQPIAAGQLRPLFGGPVIAAGGFDGAGAKAILAEGDADLVAFGRHFLANPDLPERLRHHFPLNPYDRTTFYYGGTKGYADYPAYEATRYNGASSSATGTE